MAEPTSPEISRRGFLGILGNAAKLVGLGGASMTVSQFPTKETSVQNPEANFTNLKQFGESISKKGQTPEDLIASVTKLTESITPDYKLPEGTSAQLQITLTDNSVSLIAALPSGLNITKDMAIYTGDTKALLGEINLSNLKNVHLSILEVPKQFTGELPKVITDAGFKPQATSQINENYSGTVENGTVLTENSKTITFTSPLSPDKNQFTVSKAGIGYTNLERSGEFVHFSSEEEATSVMTSLGLN